MLTFFCILGIKKLNLQLYKAVSKLKPGEKLHHQITAIARLW